VIGCCLLDVIDLRPPPLPSEVGTRLRAAAHRISVEWTDEFGQANVGVFVPARHTDSRVARVIGGRLFPGVHQAAIVEIADDGHLLEWAVCPRDRGSPYAVRVRASLPASAASAPCEPIGGTCLAATIGISPAHRDGLETAYMEPEHRCAVPAVIEELDSAFIASFASAIAAPSYLMRDVPVTWRRAPALDANTIAVTT
jgi:hypothetical protein